MNGEPVRGFVHRGTLACLTLGVVVFTIHGSLVPYDYKPRSWVDAVQGFDWVLHHRMLPQSRSDGLANLLLGVPLGFLALGAFRIDRHSVIGTLATAVLLWPCCIAFAAGIEFAQLWFPNRTCAGSDIVAQALGSAMGILGWIVAGPRIVQSFRAIVSTPSPGGRAARLLALLLIALLGVQCLPFDFETSPADWYRKYRDGGVTIEPFQEWTALASDSVRRNDKVRAWLELVTLFVPVGVLMSYLSGVWSRWSGLFLVATGALAIGLVMEAAQWPVHSRHPSVTDVNLIALSIFTGWLAGMTVVRNAPWLAVLLWIGLLAAANWWPWELSTLTESRWQKIGWIPFVSLEAKNYLFWLEEVAVKSLVFLPLGVAVSRSGIAAGFALAVSVSIGIEFGQLFVIDRFPGTTDLVLAGISGMAGAMLGRGLMTPVTDEIVDCEVAA